MPSTPALSVVSPVYKAEKIVPELVKRIAEACAQITPDFEIVLVEDGSPDNSWCAIENECAEHPYVKGVKLSRNFGQHYAITAGLSIAKGDYAAVMDCDLQDNPKYLAELYEKAKEGNDVVLTYKTRRQHSVFKNITAPIFFAIFNFLIDNKELDASKNVGSYSMLSRKAVDAFLAMTEYHRHYLMVLRTIGFKKTYVEVEHDKRFEGKSSYTFSKLLGHALDGITSQSDKLLRVSAAAGFGLCVLSLLWAAYIVFQYFHTGLLNGYASIMGFQLLSTGVILIFLGVTGLYIGKIFTQVKQRPLYIVDKTINL